MEVKSCTKCGEEKPVSDFYSDKRTNTPYSVCKPCWIARTRRWRSENTERATYLNKMGHIERRYGISRDEYEAILVAQNNRCVICNVDFEGTRGSKSPSVDHNHNTGAVREIICSGCNTAIGLAKECPNRLRAAADYLERHNA